MTARVLPAVLGWANPTRDRENLRLYALDQGPSPRWAEQPVGRVAEQALRERGGHEGDRLLVVELDRGRWITEHRLAALAELVQAVVEDALDEPGHRPACPPGREHERGWSCVCGAPWIGEALGGVGACMRVRA